MMRTAISPLFAINILLNISNLLWTSIIYPIIKVYEGCAYFVKRADERALAEAARKVEAVGGSVKLVLKRLPEEV